MSSSVSSRGRGGWCRRWSRYYGEGQIEFGSGWWWLWSRGGGGSIEAEVVVGRGGGAEMVVRGGFNLMGVVVADQRWW